MLSSNPNPEAIEWLSKNMSNINWDILSSNPNAIDLLTENKANINWDNLSSNPNAIQLLDETRNRINWSMLSKNPNPRAVELLEQNPERIGLFELSQNPNPRAIDLLVDITRQRGTRFFWDILSANPSIFDDVLRKKRNIMHGMEVSNVIYNAPTVPSGIGPNEIRKITEYLVEPEPYKRKGGKKEEQKKENTIER